MDINKAVFTTDGNTFNISMPIVKVNKETRTVSGFATLDNVDTQDDIVTADASEKAFSKWRGNVREQHIPTSAVGKLLSFRPEKYLDEKSGETYNGIYVDTYISKGAQDTWEKVLDGTLTGFSLGGGINKSQNVFTKTTDGDKKVRKVTDYTITELSVVDNPANQFANILSFQKNSAGEINATGMITETNLQNIFYCKEHESAITTSDDQAECHKCQKSMENIGWYENDDKIDETEVVKEAIKKFIDGNSFASGTNIDDNKYNITINVNGDSKKADKIAKRVLEVLKTKGGVVVAEENKVESTEEVVAPIEKSAEEEVVAPQAAELSEVEEPDLQKMLNDLTATLTTAISDGQNSTNAALEGFKEEISKSVTGVDERLSALSERFDGLEEKVNSQSESVANVEKRVDEVEGDTAIKKSGELGGESDVLQKSKSIWNGTFLPVSGLQ